MRQKADFSVVVCLFSLLLFACGTSNTINNGADNDQDNFATENETIGNDEEIVGSEEESESGNDAIESVNEDESASESEAESEAETEVELAEIEIPFMPNPIANPYKDIPYLQEYNHTTNEVEAGIGPLVAVVVTPDQYKQYVDYQFDQPTQITARGIVRHFKSGEGKGSGWELIAIPADHPDLKGAVVIAGLIHIFSDSYYYVAKPYPIPVGEETSWFETCPSPQGETINGMDATGGFLLTSGGARFSTWGCSHGYSQLDSFPGAAYAGLDDGWGVYIGGDGTLDVFIHIAGPNVASWVRRIKTEDGLKTGRIIAILRDVVVLPEPIDILLVGTDGIQGVSKEGIMLPANAPVLIDSPLFAPDRVPLGQPRAAVKASDGGFIVATAGGAYRIMDRGDGPEWRVYNAERWLPSEDVRGVATELSVPDGPVWFATAGGLATVTAKRITLEEKMSGFVDRIVKRHDRDGAVADSHLTRPGDLTSNIPWDSDNDGSWTSYWLMAECFRYQATQASDAKDHFDKSLDAMLRLRDLTGTDHFLARSVIRKSTCNLNDCNAPDDGEWFTSPDGEWWVKGDTSNDEVIAHIFMMGHAYDLCADDNQKERIRNHIRGIIGGIMDHGWQLLDLDGLVTTYGQWDPAYVNEAIPGRFGDGGVRSVEILAGLTLAYHMTGEERFLNGKRELMGKYHYDDNTVRESQYPVRKGNSDNDEMATYGFFTLLRYESDPVLRAKWMEGWLSSFQDLGKQQGSWWEMVNAVNGRSNPDISLVARWLRLAPMDMIRWEMHNSQRHDLINCPKPYKDGKIRSDQRIISYDERRCDRWNTDQFRVDGGMGGVIEMDGADVLAPYWMARYYGFIVPQP